MKMNRLHVILDEEVSRWATARATERKTDVSRLVGELLREKMQEEEAYSLVMEQYLAAGPNSPEGAGSSHLLRAEALER